ncbi:hypothetical protein P170DRAFT_450006 [Aspergillus steynii IBT 23096]|uniref:Uncharacterized protein n=1 Tax=Aspergillus steynii IBT 23096 TaxID=1392250 RepID=A0A2I2FWC9_9EURO|nr:uncharacterized protein P170DRAFT_450006 [Aspergillus steynii IBT 23096]PLB44941.1 hypothetical protein P170DRAFT_450006 [Aspergillus steynii IBT 23096]
MPTPKSYVTWFDEDDWISAVISFPSGSKWRVDTKIGEHEYYQPQLDVEELGVQSEARGSFICSKLSGDGPPSTFLKVRLQIPWIGTTTKKSSIRAQQATSDFPPGFHTEIEDLSVLKKANCSSTPSLLDWKEEQQTNDEWIPGGFKLCILMERLPGIDPSDGFINRTMDRPERDALRAAFKTAWM